MSQPQQHESVRQSKKISGTSTQEYLPIAEIRDDTVVLKNGGLRSVIETSSLNFNLKSEDEQDAISFSYQSFLNSLEFPIQIVVHSRKLEIDSYITKLKGMAETQTNPLLQSQTYEYTEYISRLVEYADIMEKKFYVIVPYNPYRAEKLNIFEKFWQNLHSKDNISEIKKRHNEFEDLKKRLNQRLNVVTSGLENCGLHLRILNTQELIELFYKIFNPITSRAQKLQNLLEQSMETDELLIELEKKDELKK